ncbi:MAG: TldD/PmbA family protein [Nanoarchaeota archaeon]
MQQLADSVISAAKIKGVSYTEARIESSKSSGFVLKNGIPHVSGYDVSKGLAVRLIFNGAMAFGSTNILDKASVTKLVDSVIKSAKASAPSALKTEFSQENPEKASYQVKQKIDVRTVSPEKKLSLLQDIDKAILSTKKSVPGRYLILGDDYVEKFFVNSEGTRINSIIPKTNFTYFTTLKEKGSLIQRYWQYGASGGFETLTALNLQKVLHDEILTLSKNTREGVKAPTGKIDMVLGPQIVGIVVHESAGHPGEADRILGREAAQAGESFLSIDSAGKKIGSDKVTIIDDPSIKNSFGYYEFDDEGVKARKRYLYKNGKITEFLHSRQTAAQTSTISNASARSSSFDREPLVRMANTYFECGEYSEEELIEGVKKGVLMRTFMEWNIDDKRFNQKYVGAEAYLIENGKITKPVRQPVLEITTPKLYSSVDAAANNIEFHAGSCGKGEPMQGMPVWFGGPSIRIRKVRLGK